jgi:hypothetical protein
MSRVIDRLVNSLEVFTREAAKLRHPDAERLIELAAVATAHAVALEALRAENAEAVWREAHRQLPEPVPLHTGAELPEQLAA